MFSAITVVHRNSLMDTIRHRVLSIIWVSLIA
ncbi:hypothetical protein T4D_5764 [Trichinella pseudospiralis]|uniref:Uncharacterized protein n=1 Tax=Trichinella pseudospiralis TaxID=6337 RepID=A0A0V1DP78_TRIPS|nr:hypothetical protein T4D_5764 [Trichinella pseudospiralis]